MFTVKTKKTKKIQLEKSKEKCCDEKPKECKPKECSPQICITACDILALAEITKNYKINRNGLGNVNLSQLFLGFSLMLQEAINGPRIDKYHPHLISQKPHCESHVTTVTHFDYYEITEFCGYFQYLPTNTDWYIQVMSDETLLPQNYLYNNIIDYTGTVDQSLVILKFIHYPETVCKGDDIQLPKCESVSSSSSSCSPIPCPSVPTPFVEGIINAHIVGRNILINEVDVNFITSLNQGITFIFKPQY